MTKLYLGVVFFVLFAGSAFADRVTLDTGNSMEGIVQEQEDRVLVKYISYREGSYQWKAAKIPRSRIRSIEYDSTYFQKYKGLIQGLGGISIPVPAAPNRGNQSLQEVIRQGSRQVDENLRYNREHMRHAKFYWGRHEGLHWDPNNGWHRWNHDGLYDPFDPNIKVIHQE